MEYKEYREQLGLAYFYASEMHRGQTDKAGKPYILHPVRVSENCFTLVGKVAALLHDIVEDTDTTEDDLRRYGFSKEVIDTVVILTRRSDETYEEYITRIIESENRYATEVKCNDLADNLSPDRELPGTEDLRKRYRKSLVRIEDYLRNKWILS